MTSLALITMGRLGAAPGLGGILSVFVVETVAVRGVALPGRLAGTVLQGAVLGDAGWPTAALADGMEAEMQASTVLAADLTR